MYFQSLNVSHLLQACGVILNLLRQHDNHAEVRPLVRKLQDLEKKKYVGKESVFREWNEGDWIWTLHSSAETLERLQTKTKEPDAEKHGGYLQV